MGKVTLKLEAKNIYSAIKTFAGIDQETILAALDGNEGAILEIADFRIQQEIRAENAEAVFGNLREGVSAMEKVVKEEVQFLNSTGASLQGMTNSWADSRLADNKLAHSIIETRQRSNYEMIEEDYSHQRRVNLLGHHHKGNIEIIRLKELQERANIRENVTSIRKKLPLRERTVNTLGSAKNFGASALRHLKQGIDFFM